MSNIDIFATIFYNRFRDQIKYDGEIYTATDEQGRLETMTESELIVYLMTETNDEYFQEHLMLTFLQEYVMKRFKDNILQSNKSPESGS